MWAAEDGNSEALKLLVKRGAKTDIRDKVSISADLRLLDTLIFYLLNLPWSDLLS